MLGHRHHQNLSVKGCLSSTNRISKYSHGYCVMLQDFGLNLAQIFEGFAFHSIYSYLVTDTTRVNVWKDEPETQTVSVNILKDILQHSSFLMSFDASFRTDSPVKISSCTDRNTAKIKV